MITRIRLYSRFIKLEHTVFALPILAAGAFLAAEGWPPKNVLFWILVAGFGARTFALALNRILDRDLDALNPRTADRELPAGLISESQAWGVAMTGVVIYLLATWRIEARLLGWSLIPLVIFWIYPQLKRRTQWAHLGVGAGLACAPLGAWMAVIWEAPPASINFVYVFFLAMFMFFWASGFDIIYSTLDEESDRANGVHSLPSVQGREAAMFVSAFLHLSAFMCLALLYIAAFRTPITGVCLGLIALLLYAEQRLSGHVQLAFFKINAVIAFVVFGFVYCGVYGL